MFIYTVRPGDSLFSISNKYNISIDDIRLVNGLEMLNIVPNQALLIPSSTYIVQPGDSLYSIAQMAFVSLEQLEAANPSLNPNDLQIGMQITIPLIEDYAVSTFNYYVTRTPELDAFLISDFAPYSSYIALFDYQFNPNGDIVNVLDDRTAIETAWRNRVVPIVTITNLVPEGFSTELVQQTLNNQTTRTNLINNIINLITERGYGGVNIDFERIATEDRDIFTQFLFELKSRLNEQYYILTVAVPPKTSEDIPWLLGYDYGGIGSVVDLMFIMTYDWHHTESEPGPVAPINEVRRTIEFAINHVPKDKIILGVPLYGYDWPIPYTPDRPGSALSNADAVNLAMQYQSPIQYSDEFATPSFRYVDESGQMHEVWFEDSRSISEKMKIMRDFKIQGLGAWQLTLGLPEGPWILTHFFTIKKI